MFDLSAYALRFLEYLVLMVLFGVPLFGWYGSRRSTLADALAGWPLMGVLLVSAAVGTVLTGADIVLKTAGIMGMPVADVDRASLGWYLRSEEHTSELQSLMRISYAVFCLKKKKK